MSYKTPAHITRNALLVGAIVLGSAILGGCYKPSGPFLLTYTGAPMTYVSTELQPKTVTIVDTRTDETIFVQEVPAGYKLVLQFRENHGEKNSTYPAAVDYKVMESAGGGWLLSESQPMPPAASRRIDISIRPAPESVPMDDDDRYRVEG